MNNEEVELVPWFRDSISGLKGEGLRRMLMGKGFESLNYQTTPGSYLVKVGHIETLYQLVGWAGDHLNPWVKVRRVGETYVGQFCPDRFLKVPSRFLQIVTPEAPKGCTQDIDWAESKVRFIPETLGVIKSLLPIAPDVLACKLLEGGFKRVSLTSAFAGDYVVDIGGDGCGNLLQIKEWWAPDTVLVLDEEGGDRVYNPNYLLRIPNHHLQSVEPTSRTTEPPKIPEATKGYTLGIDWAKPNSEESIVTYYKGVDNIPTFRPPKSFVCEYENQSITFKEVSCTTGKQDYVVCPTTGRKLNQNTLLPIEEHVDFTTRGIL